MTYKNSIIEEPTIDMIQEYINEKRFRNLSAEAIFNHYVSNGWTTTHNEPVKSIESIVNAYNGIVNPKNKIINTKTKMYDPLQYDKLLSTVEWETFKNEVLKLHNNKCDKCDETEHLNVHHKKYIKTGRKRNLPWAYFFDEMEVLCDKHHKEAHNVKTIVKV